ncbi:MAG: OmpA family protein [Candidatus Schekmanbacteria bacterium]|nr:OmpA family protein [Candidatus Schekmanbacteria bacterium]
MTKRAQRRGVRNRPLRHATCLALAMEGCSPFEERGQIADAARFYEAATRLDPDSGTAYAGLGDVRAKQGDFSAAVLAYRRFLLLLQTEGTRGDPDGLLAHESEYRQRLQSALSHVDPEALVDAEQISRSLRMPSGERARGFGVRPEVDLHIQFDFNSDRITPDSLKQIAEIAKALQSENLRSSRALLEGHTDSVGAEPYNLELSKRRAMAVGRTLIEKFALPADRFAYSGIGAAAPVASNDTEHGRALNRRVTVVNLGGAR